MNRSILGLAAALAIATASPAHAAEPPAPYVAHPLLAAALAPAVPLAYYLYVGRMVGGTDFFGTLVGYTAPMLIGAGHVYAGDPLRGALVGLSFPVVVVADTAVAMALKDVAQGQVSDLVFKGALLGWTGWAIADAYTTAQRKNLERAAAASTPTRP